MVAAESCSCETDPEQDLVVARKGDTVEYRAAKQGGPCRGHREVGIASPYDLGPPICGYEICEERVEADGQESPGNRHQEDGDQQGANLARLRKNPGKGDDHEEGGPMPDGGEGGRSIESPPLEPPPEREGEGQVRQARPGSHPGELKSGGSQPGCEHRQEGDGASGQHSVPCNVCIEMADIGPEVQGGPWCGMGVHGSLKGPDYATIARGRTS